MAATAKTIILKGDAKNPESAEHHIIFPGGSISVCRTSDNRYWAHVKVNTEKPMDGAGVYESAGGQIECVRIDTIDGVKDVDHKGTDHFAVLIAVKETHIKDESTQLKQHQAQTKLFPA